VMSVANYPNEFAACVVARCNLFIHRMLGTQARDVSLEGAFQERNNSSEG
jgi:hypothetical protein